MLRRTRLCHGKLSDGLSVCDVKVPQSHGWNTSKIISRLISQRSWLPSASKSVIWFDGIRKHTYFKQVIILRSLILIRIVSRYATSCLSSLVVVVLSCLVSEILHVFYSENDPTPILPKFWRCFRWTRLSMLRIRRP